MTVSPFHKRFDRDSFNCGNEELDGYLKRQLSQDIKRNVAACFILHEENKTEMIGYYTLSAFAVSLDGLPEKLKKQLPRYPHIPTTLLGRLAISTDGQGQGFGELLLIDALKRAWKTRDVIASWAVVVDAIDDSAIRFYQKYGFETLQWEVSRLFLPMKQVGKLFE